MNDLVVYDEQLLASGQIDWGLWSRIHSRSQAFFSSHKFKAGEPIFLITWRTAGNWLDKLVSEAEKGRGEVFPIDISTHTFRHSFSVNEILHGTDVVVLQSWLGHRDRQSTEIYSKILSRETEFLMRRIAFS